MKVHVVFCNDKPLAAIIGDLAERKLQELEEKHFKSDRRSDEWLCHWYIKPIPLLLPEQESTPSSFAEQFTGLLSLINNLSATFSSGDWSVRVKGVRAYAYFQGAPCFHRSTHRRILKDNGLDPNDFEWALDLSDNPEPP